MRRLVRYAHKLSYSYAERNQLLTSHNYPLLSCKTPRLDVAKVLRDYQHVEHTEMPDPKFQPTTTFGRVKSIRRAGKNMAFLDLVYDDAKIQVVVNFKKMHIDAAHAEMIDLLRRGDSISVEGVPWRTKAGELSILATKAPTLLSACMHPAPKDDVGETLRKYNRVAELKTFDEARTVLKARDAIITRVSQFLKDRGFTQVQTPILSSHAGGATAEPFITKEGLSLRIAPELWLKQLIIGGFERVFEIGQSFRNEGIDATHNPEFTTCEFYSTFTSLEDLMELTRGLFVATAESVASQFPQYATNGEIILQEWKTLDFFSTIEDRTGVPLPAQLDLEPLVEYFRRLDIAVPEDTRVGNLLDKLAAIYIEPLCESPTFIVHHPAVMAPLAKQTTLNVNGVDRLVSRRFELLINGREYVNAYEEENDPQQQFAKLQQQAQEQGLDRVPDQEYVKAMEWSLPPTGGWGLGIDRLVMLLTGCKRIHQVLSFGGVKQVAATPKTVPEGSNGPEASTKST